MTEKNYASLGLFLVVVLIVVLATAAFFIQRRQTREVIHAVTYTAENVSGLDVSSPVRYRGVMVGRVVDVGVDPDTLSIEVGFEVFLDRLISLGLRVRKIPADGGKTLFAGVRTQVITNPVTGESYLLLDRPENPPPAMALTFTPERVYVPSMPTMLSKVRDRLPEILEHTDASLNTLREIINRIPASFDRTDRFLTNLERVIKDSEFPALSADSRRFLATSGAQLEQIQQISANLQKLIESQQVFAQLAEETRTAIFSADLPGTSKMARDTLSRTSLAADDLRRSLPALRESLAQVRELARDLDEQPESVVYGPRRPEGKSK